MIIKHFFAVNCKDRLLSRIMQIVILGFYFHGNQRICVADEEIHFKGGAITLVIVQLVITGFTEHLSYDVFIDGTFVSTEILVSSQVLILGEKNDFGDRSSSKFLSRKR